MFGTVMEPLTFVYTVLNVLFLYNQFISWITSGRPKRKKRFLILLLIYLFYNLTNGLVPHEGIFIPVPIQLIISTSTGITLGIYLYSYLTKELDVQIGFYTTKRLAITLFGSFIGTYVLIIILTNDTYIARLTFILFPAAIAVTFAYNAIKNIRKQFLETKNPPSRLFKMLAYTSYISLLGLCVFPVAFGIGDDQVVEATILNVVLIVNIITNMYREIHQEKSEEHLIRGQDSLNGNKYVVSELSDILSTREMEVCFFLFQGEETYESIGEKMFITPKTVSKHASNIFKKTNTKSRVEFLDKYRLN